MRLTPAALCLLLALSAFLVACGGPETEAPAVKRDFTFDSGGAHHLQGFGAWRVRVGQDGRFEAVHQVRDETTPYAPSGLSPEENQALWALVDAANLAEITIAERPGVPDESELVFGLEVEGAEPVEVTLWQNDLEQHPALVAIRDALRPLVETHTGQKPLF